MTDISDLRFTIDLPSPTEARHFRVRPVAPDESGSVDELVKHAPGVRRHAPPAHSPDATSIRLGAYDDMRVLRAFMDIRLGAPVEDACFIELLIVDPRYRRAGLGSAFFEQLALRLSSAGARQIELEIDPLNAAAILFWRHLGFLKPAGAEQQNIYRHTLT